MNLHPLARLQRLAERLLPEPTPASPTPIRLAPDIAFVADTRLDWDGTYIGLLRFGGVTLEGSPEGLARLAHEAGIAAEVATAAQVLDAGRPGALDPADLPPAAQSAPVWHNGLLTARQRQALDRAPQEPMEGWTATVYVWAMAGSETLPVAPDHWTGHDDGTATAAVDDATDLHFADGQLCASSRCRHDHIHRTTVEHPTDLDTVRRQARECAGDEDLTA
ncbi:hypothetical protein [Streptomyces filamentosus]|uniref:hypothetical protein n=1 Tax=Streptomyces filamentosus TaxID=67294 RepID=UPI0033CE32D2